jgi:flavodoxin
MKTAVVVYSLDGNCALVAEEIKSQLNAELIRIFTEDEKKRSKIGKILWGGGMAVRGKKPPLKPYSFDPSAFDLIILGAPVWAGHPAPPIKTFLSNTAITGKKVALFVCHGGGKGSSLKKFRALLTGNQIVAETDFFDPAKEGIEKVRQKVADWVKSIGE